MKIISLHTDYSDLIAAAIRKDRKAQKELFELFSPRMLGVCRWYIRCEDRAEEVMLTGFMKVFSNLKNFENKGSFEGWIRRIMVHEAISHLRKEKKFRFVKEEDLEKMENISVEMDSKLEAEEIQELIDTLPDGYKTVFVLFVVEGYQHKEIAEMLRISENTSRSQLFKARKMLQELVKQQNRIFYESV